MTQALAQILEDAAQLSAAERVELTDRLVEGLVNEPSPEVTELQLAEVRRRIKQVETGEAVLIPGEQVLAQARARLAAAKLARQ